MLQKFLWIQTKHGIVKLFLKNKIHFYENDFSKIKNKSIDYSVLEKEKKY